MARGSDTDRLDCHTRGLRLRGFGAVLGVSPPIAQDDLDRRNTAHAATITAGVTTQPSDGVSHAHDVSGSSDEVRSAVDPDTRRGPDQVALGVRLS
jgi:hypothetical protein